jgi:small-conductance mechanosensitive channel/uncharacterized protein YndB with AHSA1/START domain
MTAAAQSERYQVRQTSGLYAALLLLAPLLGHAQEPPAFDEIAAAAEIRDINEQLDIETVDEAFLNSIRPRIVDFEAEATACSERETEARTRLQQRFEPLREIDAEVAGMEIMDQRQEIRAALDEAIAAQSRCDGVKDEADLLAARITDIQNKLSQQFLSSRSQSIIALIREFPVRAATWPSQIGRSLSPKLDEDVTPVHLLWLLVIAGGLAALLGLYARHKFNVWYGAAGGDSAPPQMKYLGPKPIAEFAPLWLEGAALLGVLLLTIEDASIDLLVIRVAVAILILGLGGVVIKWATGPLSPSAEVKGLIPDHVEPLRLRLRFLLLTICTSFVVLGGNWLSVRIMQPYVTGRATMIFLLATALLAILTYLRRIPAIHGRYRILRGVGIAASSFGIIGVLTGYQNLAGFVIHGLTRTGLALFILWILLWTVYQSFHYLMQQDTPAAAQMRATLGVTETGSRTGIGFMQLIADLVLWLSFVVYMIYVWDDSGTTLDRLYDLIVFGTTIGSIKLVPLKMIGSIFIFAGIIVLIGWIKRWIDRRWLQHINMERGARDAIVTLFGYVGFVAAVLISLVLAGVDLGGLAIVSAALMVGIGFGVQEIANNFISGLILLFERPIRAGDFISVGEVEGFVRSIRIRATEVETLDNQNVLVPNSELVSGRVTNWVLRDTHGRLRLVVGVAYGTDVERVREILESVAREHSDVITDGRAPAPRALFTGFGDSSLDFELRVRITRIERRFSVISDLNFAIDKAFREDGITIPFPQRDLHIVSYPEQHQAPAKIVEPHKPVVSTHTDPVTRSHRAELEAACEIDEVWAAITQIDEINRWLAREGTFAPYIGGTFDLALRDGYNLRGRIDVYMPPRRIRAVIQPMREEGPLPTGPITAEILLRETDGNTLMTVIVAGIPDSEDWEDYYRLSEDRWKNALDALKSDVLRQ